MNSPDNAAADVQIALTRFIDACQSDPRVRTATLYGSLARGTADDWSDLDIGVVLADDAYDEFVAGREAFVRQLGEPLFIEDFDIPGILFFILADGTEGELSIDRAGDFTEPHGAWRALVDKDGTLSRARPRPEPDPDERAELLRGQIMWFWHDLSHFITAVGRGQLWWASGQMEMLRRTCVNLGRLRHDLNDPEVGDDPFFKLDKALPGEALAALRPTFVPQERAALLGAARIILEFYRALARPLAEEHGIRYPAELEALLRHRMAQLDG